jgi:hypothetical protein
MLNRFVWCLCLLVSSALSAQKITPASVQTLTGLNTADASFDGLTTTGWFPGWKPAGYPAKALIDLGAEYHLNKVRIFDGPGQPNLTFTVQNQAAPFLTIPCTLYMAWKEQAVDLTARFIVIEIPDIQGEKVVPEIEFHGTTTSNPGGGGGGGPVAGFQKINPLSVTTQNGQSNAALSFDGSTATGWFPGWNAGDYPARAVVDLGAVYDVGRIKVYDGPGITDLSFKIQGQNQAIMSIPLNQYMAWHEHNVSFQAQFLEVAISSIAGEKVVPEIEIWGTPSDTVIVVDPPGGGDTTVIDTPTTVILGALSGDATKLGMNGFDWIPMNLHIFGRFRMYQYLSWTWTGLNGKIKVAPTARGDANYDVWLTTAKAKGIEAVFCPNKVPGFLVGQDPNNWGEWMDGRFHPVGADGTNPASYVEVAKYYWQIAARWGRQTHPVSLLNIDLSQAYPGQPVNEAKSGMNLLRYIEIENEADRPWKTPEFKYTPQQFAALMSAAYDGHCGTLGPGVGIKAADPTMKVVLGGLSAINTAYLQEMYEWCVANRPDGKFPADVLNVHHYCLSENPPLPAQNINLVNSFGVSPEEDNLKARLLLFKNWGDSHVPTADLWYTEFGYDTKPPATILSTYPQLYGGHSAEHLQSIWLARTYLEAITTGMDAAMMYNGIDENSAHVGWLYGSSGLYSGQWPQDGSTPFQPKEAVAFQSWLVNKLNGFHYSADESQSNMRVYAFVKGDTTRYFYWSPTANNTTVSATIAGIPVTATETPQVLEHVPTTNANRDVRQTASTIRVYPNPAVDRLIIEGPVQSVKLLDPSGRVLVGGTTDQLFLGGLPGGLYLVEIVDTDGRRSLHRIVKL